jgi:hypothetical protein
MGRRLYRLVETRSYRYKQYGPGGSGGSESLPQSKEENGLDSTRKYHPRLDSRLHRRIVSAATHFLRSGRERRWQPVWRLSKTSRSYRSPLAQGRFPAYLGPFPDHLLPDRCLDRADHPPLRSGTFTAIGSVRPMIGKGPIGLWGLSKRFVATTSELIGVIDRFRVG